MLTGLFEQIHLIVILLIVMLVFGAKTLINMARLERFELPALGTGIRCSIRTELQAHFFPPPF